MNCNDAKEYLTLMADEEEILEDSLREHLNNCDNCKKYYENILKTKEIISKKPQHNPINIDIELTKIKSKIDYVENNSKKHKIYNILFKSTIRKVIFTTILCAFIAVIPLSNTSIVKALNDFWCNKIIFNKSNIKIEEGDYKVDVAKEYPEQYKLLQERDKLIKETLALNDKKTAYEKIDKIVEEYDEKIWDADKKRFTVKFEDKKYDDLELFQRYANHKLPSVPQNFKFSYARYYTSEYVKMITFNYNDTNDDNRLNNMRKPLYIKYVYFNEIVPDQNATLQKDTKFKKINVQEHDGYLAMNKNGNDTISLSICVFMDNYNIIIITNSDEKKLQENEQLLLKIMESLVSQK